MLESDLPHDSVAPICVGESLGFDFFIEVQHLPPEINVYHHFDFWGVHLCLIQQIEGEKDADSPGERGCWKEVT